MKRLIIFLLCLCIVGGGGFFGYRSYKQSQDEKRVVDVVPVSLMAESADMYVYDEEMYGEIICANSQKIYVDTDKLIEKVCVQQGDEVKAGDTILEYDMTVVDLELAQKENQVKVIEQNIKMAKKELEEIKTYQPSENAPQTDESDYTDEPQSYDETDYTQDVLDDEPSAQADVPTEEEEYDEPIFVETADVVKPAFVPDGGIGSKDDPYIISCNLNTSVTKLFMARLASAKQYAQLWVYDDNSVILYKWSIDCEKINISEISDWCVGDGVTIDEDTGLISVDASSIDFASFSIEMPESSSDNEADDYSDDYDVTDAYADEDYDDYEDFDDYEDNVDYSDDEQYTDDESDDAASMDYVYSKAEIKQLISEKESDIKQMQLELKSANIEYETAKKQKSDGKVVAEIDGVVKRIGSVSADEEDSEDIYADEEYYDEEDYSDSDAFAIIEGDGGAEVECEVCELDLQNTQVGTALTVMSWETGTYTQAEVTRISTEPYSYTAVNWGDNPNSSTYHVYARLTDSTDFAAGDWVSVMLDDTEDSSSGSVYLPLHYVRQEGGNYYIMKADENDRLVKQYVRAGQIMYGYAIEIKGGLSMSDRICFPYGTNVEEGVRTKDSTEVLYPEDY